MFLIDPYRFAPAGDPYFSNVSLLLHGDGTNGSTTIVDSSPSPKTVTAVGSAQISTAQSRFGGSSLRLPGNGSSLETNVSNDFLFGTDAFTIECWVYFLELTTSTTIMRLDAGVQNDGILFGHFSNLGCYITSNATSWNMVSNQPLTGATVLNTWHYVALTRNGNTFKGWVNGANVWTVTASGYIYQSNPMARIGAANTSGQTAMNGYIDELRITKGVARDVSVVPTAPFPNQ